MFDEFQDTAAYLLPRGLFHANFRKLTQNQRNVGYIYTGSAIGMIQDIFGNPQNPLAGNVEMIYVEPFPVETTVAFLKKKFAEEGFVISDKYAERMHSLTGGFPAYLNWMGLRLCSIAKRKEISETDIMTIYDEMLSLKSPIYQMIDRQLAKLGARTKSIIKAVALGHSTPPEMHRETGVKNVYVYLNRLEKYGIVKKEKSFFSLVDCIMAEYFKRA
jgi:AAA+ ATPase superfamily predicted ATPase